MAKKATKKPATRLGARFKPLASTMDGFFIVEEGNQIVGTLLEAFTVTTKYGPKKVYKIQVTDNDPATRITNKVKGEIDAEEGSIVGVDEKGYLKKLATVAIGTEVMIVCTGREEVARVKGQSPAWTFEVGSVERTSHDKGDDDIPF